MSEIIINKADLISEFDIQLRTWNLESIPFSDIPYVYRLANSVKEMKAAYGRPATDGESKNLMSKNISDLSIDFSDELDSSKGVIIIGESTTNSSIRHEWRHHWQYQTKNFYSKTTKTRRVSPSDPNNDDTFYYVVNNIHESDAWSYTFIHCGVNTLMDVLVYEYIESNLNKNSNVFDPMCKKIWMERMELINTTKLSRFVIKFIK